jgi:hypothetical protein
MLSVQHEFRTFTAKEYCMRYCNRTRSLDSSVSIVTSLYAEHVGSTPGRIEIFSSSPKHPDNLWCPPSCLINVYQALLPRRLQQPGLKLTTLPDIVLSLRIIGATLSAPPPPQYAFKAGIGTTSAALQQKLQILQV